MTSPIRFKCPTCRKDIEANAGDAGKEFPCPNPECQGLVRVPLEATTSSRAPVGERFWYVTRNGKRSGPISSPELRQLAEEGRLGPDDLVWTDGWPEWRPMRHAFGRMSAPPPTAPPVVSGPGTAQQVTLSAGAGGAPTVPAPQNDDGGLSRKVIRRYRDGYSYAQSLNWFGSLVKIGGLVIGAVMAFTALGVIGNASGTFGVILLIAAVGVGGAVYSLGVLICAFGQLLLAVLDSSIHTSPFLDNDQRAAAMSL